MADRWSVIRLQPNREKIEAGIMETLYVVGVTAPIPYVPLFIVY
jgi:hypothetical protein